MVKLLFDSVAWDGVWKYLQRNGYLRTKDGVVMLTRKGMAAVKKWSGIEKFANLPYQSAFLNLIYLPSRVWVRLAYQCRGLGSSRGRIPYRRKWILLTMFDWLALSDAQWHNFHAVLLAQIIRTDWSHLSAKQPLTENIPDTVRIYTSDYADSFLLLQKYLAHWFFEDKIEGSNYIYNRWYILEAINMIHHLLGVAPTIQDIARVCFIAFPNKGDVQVWVERRLRSDVKILERHGFIDSRRDGRRNLYTVTGQAFECTDRTYALSPKEMVHQYYNQMGSKPPLLRDTI